MNHDFENELSSALSANGSYDEDKAGQQRSDLRDKFRAGTVKMERITWVYLLLFTAVGAYCAGRLILANDPRDAVLFGVVLFVMVLNQRVITLWYWLMNVKISVLKELKLLRLSLASGEASMTAAEETDIEMLLRNPLTHGRESKALERRLRYGVLVAVALACGFLGVRDAQRKARMAALSAKELAVWHLDASGTVTATSRILIDESSAPSSTLTLALPYPSGTLESVSLNGQVASFEAAGKGKYDVTIPAEFVMEDMEMNATWRFPFSAFEPGEYGYRTVLKALVPVRAYTLNVVVDDASGYDLAPWMRKGSGTPFTATYDSPRQNLGSCGLGVSRP